jgi:hypothetical protein
MLGHRPDPLRNDGPFFTYRRLDGFRAATTPSGCSCSARPFVRRRPGDLAMHAVKATGQHLTESASLLRAAIYLPNVDCQSVRRGFLALLSQKVTCDALGDSGIRHIGLEEICRFQLRRGSLSTSIVATSSWSTICTSNRGVGAGDVGADIHHLNPLRSVASDFLGDSWVNERG